MRFVIALIGYITIITGPWWIPLICIALLCMRWRAIEALGIGLCMDFIWQSDSLLAGTSWHTLPLFTIFSIALLWGLEPLRRQLLVF